MVFLLFRGQIVVRFNSMLDYIYSRLSFIFKKNPVVVSVHEIGFGYACVREFSLSNLLIRMVVISWSPRLRDNIILCMTLETLDVTEFLEIWTAPVYKNHCYSQAVHHMIFIHQLHFVLPCNFQSSGIIQ